MNVNVRRAALALASVSTLGACATKGFVRNQVQSERVARVAADSAMQGQFNSEITSVRSDVASLRSDVQGLRNDLQSLRTDFGARITAMEEGMKFAFPVNFAYNDTTVRDTDRPALDRFAKVVQKYYNGSKITVEGFADPAGSARYNVKLSKERADAVKSYLVAQGLPAENLRVVGYGKTRLVNPGAAKDAPGAEANRRVVFVVESRGASTVALGPTEQP